MDKTLYCLKDKNDNFVKYDSELECLFIGTLERDAICYSNEVKAKDMVFNLEEMWKDGEIGKTNIEFPLRAVKVTIKYEIEELK